MGGYGKGKGGRRGGRGSGNGGQDSQKTKLKCVDEWNHLSKKLMKAYPDKDTGAMIKYDSKKLFKKETLLEWLQPEYSELAARPPMGLNLICSTIAECSVAVVAAAKNKESTGFAKLVELFDDDTLRPLVELAQVDAQGGKDDKAQAVKRLLEFAANEDDAAKRLKALGAVADTASRLWGFATAWAQLIAAAQKPKDWAKRVPDVDKQHKSLKGWVDNPKKLEKLAKATADAYEDRFYWGGKKKRRREFGAEESDDDSEDDSDDSDKSSDDARSSGDGSSSDAGSSSSDDKKKKDKKKGKKGKKEKNKKKPKKDKKKGDKKRKEDAKKGKKDKDSDKSKKKGKDSKKAKKSDSSSDGDESSASSSKDKEGKDKKEKKERKSKGDGEEEKHEEETNPFRKWGHASVAKFKTMLEAYKFEESAVTDFCGLVAVPPRDLMKKYWSRIDEIPIGKPEQDKVAEDFLQDEERRSFALKQCQALLDAAEAALADS